MGLTQGQSGLHTGAGRGGAWESTKYQLEGKLLFTKYRRADIEKEKNEQKYSLLRHSVYKLEELNNRERTEISIVAMVGMVDDATTGRTHVVHNVVLLG